MALSATGSRREKRRPPLRAALSPGGAAPAYGRDSCPERRTFSGRRGGAVREPASRHPLGVSATSAGICFDGRSDSEPSATSVAVAAHRPVILQTASSLAGPVTLGLRKWCDTAAAAAADAPPPVTRRRGGSSAGLTPSSAPVVTAVPRRVTAATCRLRGVPCCCFPNPCRPCRRRIRVSSAPCSRSQLSGGTGVTDRRGGAPGSGSGTPSCC